MKHFNMATARQHFSDVLDAAENGDAVIIERRGVQFELSTRKGPKPASRKQPPRVALLDPAVDAGQWTWSSGSDGQLRFVARKPRKK